MGINKREKQKYLLLVGLLFFLIILSMVSMGFIGNIKMSYIKGQEMVKAIIDVPKVIPPILDEVAYDLKLKELANNPPAIIPKPTTKKVTDPKTGKITIVSVPAPVVIPKPNLWPVKTVYPNGGAILPFSRIIAYYGNLYSTKMGVLGEYPEPIMLEKLKSEVKKWETADPSTPAIPALHYIVVTAQGSGGQDGKYRFRMPDKEIDKVITMAQKINALVFLDIQVGLSDIQTELPLLDKYLSRTEVHLGVDPEFYMKTGARPGKVIGTLDASEINFMIEHLSKVVS